MDLQKSPTPTPGADLGSPPCGGRRVKQGTGVGGWIGGREQVRPEELARLSAMPVVRTGLPSLSRAQGRRSIWPRGRRPEQGIAPAFPPSSFYRRTHADGASSQKGEEKEMKAGLEDGPSQDPAALPATKGQRQTSGAWREASDLFGVVASGKPQRANKYYLQTGRRSRGGGTMGVWGHTLWRSPTSNKTG